MRLTETNIFNPRPQVQTIIMPTGQACMIVDDALVNPEALLQLAVSELAQFENALFNAYPGIQLSMPAAFSNSLNEFFSLHIRSKLNARRTLHMHSRLAMVTLPPEQLQPRQSICHRDSAWIEPNQSIAASVLYLFKDLGLGGTSFFVPKKSSQITSLLVHDSGTMSAEMFQQKYGIKPSYFSESNDYFEKMYTAPPKWNRMIFYDGSIFHSGDILQTSGANLSADPLKGRLTLNGFFTCSRRAS